MSQATAGLDWAVFSTFSEALRDDMFIQWLVSLSNGKLINDRNMIKKAEYLQLVQFEGEKLVLTSRGKATVRAYELINLPPPPDS